jgi:regulator of replication initiation timing
MPHRLTLCLESKTQYLSWLADINAFGQGQSHWICAMVERARSSTQDFSAAKELQKVREENNKLRIENQLLLTSLQKEKSKNFKLQVRPATIGEGEKLNVAPILRQGGHWSQRQLMESLQIDPVDIEALQIVRRQLEVLQDAGFIEDTGSGWRWIK